MTDAKSAGRGGLTVFLCVLVALCEGIDLQAAGLAAAGIKAAYAPDAQTLGTFFSASTFGLFFGALLGGPLSDRIGRKGVLVVSVALFGVFSILTAFAGSMEQLTWARVFTGLGLGGALPNLIALVSESSPDDRRSANVAFAYAGTPFGGALISLFNFSVTPAQWHQIFIIGGVVPLFVAPLLALYLQESAEFSGARAAAARGAIAGNAATTEGKLAALFGGAQWLRTLLLWISFFLGLLTLYLLLNWLPTLLIDGGLTGAQSTLAQVAFNLGGAVAAFLIGRLLEGPYRRPAVILAFAAVPVLIYALAANGLGVAAIVSVVFVLGIAVLSAQAVLYAIAPGFYPTLARGLGVGLAVAIGRTGSIVGPKYGGYLKAQGLNTSQLLHQLLPFVIAGSIAAILLILLRSSKR
ncbi:MAG: MFS transporter [Steroidobacteraceae bacterium]